MYVAILNDLGNYTTDGGNIDQIKWDSAKKHGEMSYEGRKFEKCEYPPVLRQLLISQAKHASDD